MSRTYKRGSTFKGNCHSEKMYKRMSNRERRRSNKQKLEIQKEEYEEPIIQSTRRREDNYDWVVW